MSWHELLPALTTIGKILLIIVPLLLSVAYLTLAERKVIGYMQVRLGPNRVTFFGIPWLRGWAQPIADVLKMLLKEIVVPSGANKIVFLLAPILSLAPAFVAWSVVPFSPEVVLANIDAGLLFIMAASSMGVYGVVMAGWASNSKYAFIGGLRCAAQIVSYEIAMGFALVGVLMVAGSLNLVHIVQGQAGTFGLLQWNWLPLLPLFVIYFVSGVAETNRAPFDVAEGESEIVAGFHVEYSGIAFGVFFLAEYANMILISMLAAILFLGGWLPPFPVAPFTWIPGFLWLLMKVAVLLLMFVWFRATFPRYRYDQIMRLGWKVFIPITIVWLVVVGFLMQEPIRQWPPFNLWF